MFEKGLMNVRNLSVKVLNANELEFFSNVTIMCIQCTECSGEAVYGNILEAKILIQVSVCGDLK